METKAVNYGFISQMLMLQSISKPLTYEVLHKQKLEQEQPVAEGKMSKQKMNVGFSPQGQAAFDRGVTLNDILKKHQINA